MFQVDDYEVTFRYAESKDGKKLTFCDIEKTGDFFSTGYAACVKGDNFVKNTGRKLALTRALDDFRLNRDLRKRFWDAYFTARNGKH